MKKYLFIILLLSSYSLFAKDISTILVDSSHQYLGVDVKNRSTVSDYTVFPSESIMIDISGFKFQKSENMKSARPNFLQLISGEEKLLTIELKPDVKIYELSVKTLKSVKGEFNGFREGERFTIAIGQLFFLEKTKQYSYTPQWVGVLNVKS